MVKGNNLSAFSTGVAPGRTDPIEQERTVEEIRQDIAARRESITETVDRLSDRVQETFDWRTYVSDYPMVAIGVAAGLGFLASSFLKTRSTPAERATEALADCFEDVTGRIRSQLDQVTPQRSGLSQTVKTAVSGLLFKTATDYVKGRFVGDSQHSSTTRNEQSHQPTQSRVIMPEEW